jgi:lipopolysaccharide transport system permease protein
MSVEATEATPAAEYTLPRTLEHTEKPVLEIVGGKGGLNRRSLHELWVFREVMMAFLVRQVKVKYKQAVVGIGWAIIQPVLSAAVFAVFLGRVAKVGSEGVPYLLFALAGMVAWSYFAAAASGSMDSLVVDSQLLRKVYFPREVLPLANVGASLVDLIPGLATLFIVAILLGYPPNWAWITLPIPIVILVLAASALGLGLSGVNVYYRDVRYALPFLLSVGLFASPTVYSLSQIPATWRTIYAIINPIAAAIDGIRRPILHGQWPQWGITLGALAWTIVLCIAAYALFKRIERGFSDRV